VCKRNFAVSTVTEGEQATGGAVAKREEEGPNGGEAAAVPRARREFLHDAQIAKDKWPSLLGSDSLCKAVINSKAMSWYACSRTHWFEMTSGRRFEGVAAACEADTNSGRWQILKDKWPSILESGGLCSSVVNGKAVVFLNDTEIPKDKWLSLLKKSSLCSAVVNGKAVTWYASST
jgi:hypothetical protein